jgi:putative colanic acid biosysnthesis UDP-glucose lipid carrier transferase
MVRRYSQFLEITYFLVDILILNLSYFIGLFLTFERFSKVTDKKFAMLLVAINFMWFLVTSVGNYYKVDRKIGYETIFIRFIKILAFQVLLTFAYIVVLKGYTLSRELLLWTYFNFTVLNLAWRIGFETFMKRYRARGGNYRRIIVVGANRAAMQFVQEIEQHNEYGYKFMGYFDNEPILALEADTKGGLQDIKWYCFENHIDEIYCALMPNKNEELINELMSFADDNLIRFRIIPEFTEYINRRFKKVSIEYYGNMPILTTRPEPLDNLYNRLLKRSFDIVFSLVFLILIGSWLFPLLALAVRLNSKGPVFFIQKRSGERNKEFLCYKFRTMYVNKEADSRQAIKDDPRITSVGRFLRKSNLDELPQFLNVLFGDMSVVGPRPHMLKHTEEYSKIVNSFMVRHFVKPGITGAAQANGYRGDTTDPKLMEKRVQYDVWYLENWSFWLDVKIVFLTVWSMLKGNENAF